MAAPVTKPARRPSPLAQAAVDLGAVPVAPEEPEYPDFQEEDTDMDSPSMFASSVTHEVPAPATDTVQIHGSFDGFPVVYATGVNLGYGDLNIILAELTAILRESGITPPAPATIATPAAPQNSGANRDVWNDGSKTAAATPGNDWQTCGHGPQHVEADTKFGGMRCKFRSNDFFPGSRHWSSQDGTKQAFFCKVNSRGGGQ